MFLQITYNNNNNFLFTAVLLALTSSTLPPQHLHGFWIYPSLRLSNDTTLWP